MLISSALCDQFVSYSGSEGSRHWTPAPIPNLDFLSFMATIAKCLLVRPTSPPYRGKHVEGPLFSNSPSLSWQDSL